MESYLSDAQRLVTYLARLAGRLPLPEREQFLTNQTKMQQAGMNYHKRMTAKLNGTALSKSDVVTLAARLRQEYQKTKNIGKALSPTLEFCRQAY